MFLFTYIANLIKRAQTVKTTSFAATEGPLLVAQLVEALRYKSEGRGFDSRWWHCNFSLT